MILRNSLPAVLSRFVRPPFSGENFWREGSLCAVKESGDTYVFIKNKSWQDSRLRGNGISFFDLFLRLRNHPINFFLFIDLRKILK
jgi:hypothetical protein